ncbi:glycosyltransferase family protein [Methylohalobius crimeensis]|uniref:hypothetical protein n=1 Tax=Methylohalobius crimeensis TaxID=244365 RepID=UPI00041386B6|nr:hypothetical protein [Methylohalobius crimeensis]
MRDIKKKKILIITQCFPPHGGSGVQRPLFFSKYLSELGWQCVVLTTEADDYFIHDTSLLDHVHESTKVIRVNDPKANQSLYNWCTKIDRKIASFFSKIPLAWKINNKISKITRTSFRPIIRILNIPDDLIGCLPRLLWHGYHIIKSDQPDIIFSTSPPPTTHLAGCLLAKSRGIPWVADLRDEWTLSPLKKYPSILYKRIDLILEKITLSQPNKILATTPFIGRDTARQINRCIDDFMTLTNGHVIENIESHLQRSSGVLNLTFSGVLPKERSPLTLVNAISNLINTDKIGEEIVFNIIGYQSELYKPILDKSWIKLHGYISHLENLESLKCSDVLVLITGEKEKRSYAGKIFEYIAIGKPILVLCSLDSATFYFFEKIKNNVFVADINDTCSIENQIILIYSLWKQNKLPFHVERPETRDYHRRVLTKKLDNILTDILTNIHAG